MIHRKGFPEFEKNMAYLQEAEPDLEVFLALDPREAAARLEKMVAGIIGAIGATFAESFEQPTDTIKGPFVANDYLLSLLEDSRTMLKCMAAGKLTSGQSRIMTNLLTASKILHESGRDYYREDVNFHVMRIVQGIGLGCLAVDGFDLGSIR